MGGVPVLPYCGYDISHTLFSQATSRVHNNRRNESDSGGCPIRVALTFRKLIMADDEAETWL